MILLVYDDDDDDDDDDIIEIIIVHTLDAMKLETCNGAEREVDFRKRPFCVGTMSSPADS